MTKASGLAFLTKAGHIVTTVEDGPRRDLRFTYRGIHVTLRTDENDRDFLALECSYGLTGPRADELDALRALMKLQNRFKVAKFDYDAEGTRVTASIEEIVPENDALHGVFWRSVDIAVTAAGEAARLLDTNAVAASAAARFIRQLDDEFHPRR